MRNGKMKKKGIKAWKVKKPTLNLTLAQLAAESTSGFCMFNEVAYLCMGVVKLDDPVPNWDTEAMAKGKDWRRG